MKPSGKPPADLAHMRTALLEHSGGFRLDSGLNIWADSFPASAGVVVACGKQAERALAECWDGPLLVVPHPAARVLTDALYCRGYELLRCGLAGKVTLRQERGRISEQVIVPERMLG